MDERATFVPGRKKGNANGRFMGTVYGVDRGRVLHMMPVGEVQPGGAGMPVCQEDRVRSVFQDCTTCYMMCGYCLFLWLGISLLSGGLGSVVLVCMVAVFCVAVLLLSEQDSVSPPLGVEPAPIRQMNRQRG